MEDPLDAVDAEIQELRNKLKAAKERRDKLKADREVWPKLVQVSVGRGEWSEQLMEAFAEALGWTPKKDNGPSGWGYILSQAWLYFEVHKDGQIRLVGAWDHSTGAVGKTDCPPGRENRTNFPGGSRE